ncbi:uncharacterized protein LOC107781519 [Nicotiana tabacum]|uniref:Uncharacterized protein LOC107781519 n=1 Tax=Nicotiana tabacum TaxID=4097 RepID=A0AC58SFD0_TOBAC
MDNVPVGITRDQWTSFVNYRYKEETQMAETGRKPGRAQLYLATHTKNDGSYVNEEAKEICLSDELVDPFHLWMQEDLLALVIPVTAIEIHFNRSGCIRIT